MEPANSAESEILSVAVWKALPGMGAASLGTWREHEGHYVLLRHWKSEDARRAAQEDPDMLRCWARLGNEIEIVKVYETLSEVRRDSGK
jgi:hypothetical protein